MGTVGDVTLGESWSLDKGLTAATDYHGTIGVATDPEGAVTFLDLSASPLFDAFPGTFRVNHRQHVIMRLDQYVAARLVWPDDPQGVSLTLIESGVHGGSLTVPHVPDGVTCDFQTHDDDGALRPVADWALTPAEDGVHDLLTWPNPTLTGHTAWLAFEFHRDTRNDGRFALGIRDGLLCGLPGDPLAGSVIVGSAYFTDTAHPAVTAGALPLRYRPYAPADALAYPNAWTLATRLSAPAAGQRALLTLGTESAALLLATGENGNEIVLRRTDGTAAEELFRVTLTDAQSTMHTFGLVRDGATLTAYLDGAFLCERPLPEGWAPGPGLRVGDLPEALQSLATPVAPEEGGAIDYLRLYPGTSSDAAMRDLADRTPAVLRNRRYIRDINGENFWWVAKDAWLDEATGARVDQPAEGATCLIRLAAGENSIQVNVERDAEHHFYSPDRTYAALHIEPQGGVTAPATLRIVPYGVTQPERDASGATNPDWVRQSTFCHWTTDPAENTEGNRTGFRYGRLRFTGGAGDPVHGDSHAAAVLFPGGNVELSRTYDGDFAWDEASTYIYPSPDYATPDGNYKRYICVQFGYRTYTVTWGPGSGVEGIFDAGACHFSPSAEIVVKTTTAGEQTFKESTRRSGYYHKQLNPKQELFTWHKEDSRYTTSESQSDGRTPVAPVSTLRLVAGPSLTRGRGGEAATCRLTGPVVIENVRASGGRDCVPGNATDADQAAPDVWVPSAGANSMQLPSWVFSDATRAEAQGGEANADGKANGLFARYTPTAGRLYLDCTQRHVSGDFRNQDWYLHGYKGTAGATPATAYDYLHATAFRIRLAANDNNRDGVTLTLNHLPDAPVETFVVEDATPPGTDATPTLALTLQGAEPLPVRTIITGARLDISNAGGKPALDLCPDGIPAPVHGGTGGRGALILGNATIDWDFGAIGSVPRLEVAEGRTLTLKGPQDLQASGTALVAQAGATLAQVGPDPLRGTDVELGEGATLAFQAAGEEGLALSGELLLSGSGATLRGSAAKAGATPGFSATGGIRAAQSGAVLTVDTPDAWHLRTAKMTGEGLGLTKTGPGAVEIRDTVAPTLSGPVRVEGGTLRVAKQSPAKGTPIGAHGLHVEVGATLAANDAREGEGWLLADLPAGATLSGGGTVAGGLVRLANGATYRANLGEALTADGFVPADPDATADIRVDLPEGYGADTPFLVAERIEPDPTATPAAANVRRHLRALRDGAIWDTVAAQRGGRTEYAARQASIIPTPELAATHPDLAGNLWETAIHDGLLDLSRFRNAPYVGDSRGLTRATTRTLSAAEIGHVLTCFSGVLAFSDGAAEDDVRYVDAQGLRVAYEFGISRVADVEVGGQPFTVVEIALRHALPETFPELAGRTLPEADFRDGVRVALATHDATGAKRLLGEADGVVEVTDLTGREPGVCPTPGRRFLRLPPGHATLQAIALPPAEE